MKNIDVLQGCVKDLDREKLPRRLEQADRCVKSIANIISADISEAAAAPTKPHSQSIVSKPERKSDNYQLTPRIKTEELVFAGSGYLKHTDLDTGKETVERLY